MKEGTFDSIFLLYLFLCIGLINGIVIYLYKSKNISMWISSIITGIITIPIAFFLFIQLGLKILSLEEPNGEHVQAGIGAALIGFVMGFNLIILFIIGIYQEIRKFFKKKSETTN